MSIDQPHQRNDETGVLNDRLFALGLEQISCLENPGHYGERNRQKGKGLLINKLIIFM